MPLLTVNVTIISFSIRIFSIAAVICTVLVLPVNYYGKDRMHKIIPLESLDVFTIENVKEGSKWYDLSLFIFHGSAGYVNLVRIVNIVYKLRKTIACIRFLDLS